MRDHLVRIHIAAGAGSSLKHIDGEMRIVLAFRNLERGALDRFRQIRRERFQFGVGVCSTPFDQSERSNEGARHTQPADLKIVDCTLGLRPPKCFRGYFQLA